METALRPLEKGGTDAFTTNAAAASAGVSIERYQFFPNKEAIFDTLADREMAAMSGRVPAAMEDTTIRSTDVRIEAIVRAVAASYGDRRMAHRLVTVHSLRRGGDRLAPLLSTLTQHLSLELPTGAIRRALDRTDAFVLAHAFASVLRAMTSEDRDAPPQGDIAKALARLVINFLE